MVKTRIKILLSKIGRKFARLASSYVGLAKTLFLPTFSQHNWPSGPFSELCAFAKSQTFSVNIDRHIAPLLEHRFDLLGVNAIDAGFIDPSPFDESRWLKQHINPKNRPYSRNIRRLLKHIQPDYRPIDWQKDFKSESGYRWNSRTFSRFIPFHSDCNIDIKTPWELSRFQHTSLLAIAYRQTAEEKYARELVCQILDWISLNPPQFGVNWVCTMDAAIRVANWIFWYPCIESWIDQQPWKDDFYAIFLNSLYDHLRFIPKNLEYIGSLTHNHYLADIASLFVLTSLTGDLFPENADLNQFAINELQQEIQKQVYPDGTDFEASTCYHKLACELFFFPTVIAVLRDPAFTGRNHRQIAETIFGHAYIDRLYNMFDAVYHLIKPDGSLPQIGDNDSGRFLTLFPRSALDGRYLLALGAVFFRESRWKIREFFTSPADWAELTILFGHKGIAIWEELPWAHLADITSHAFPDSGWYVMRSDNHYCLVSCGPVGLNGLGGHTHNDKLSFDLVINGRPLVVDPGTYVYGPSYEWRNRFRSVQSHNTIIVNGLEQDEFDPSDIFRLKQCCRVKCLGFEIGHEKDGFIGSLTHPQYTLKRIVEFHKQKGTVLIRDELQQADSLPYTTNLVLSPEVRAKELLLSTDGTMTQCEGWFSSEYGQKVPTQVLQIHNHSYLEISS